MMLPLICGLLYTEYWFLRFLRFFYNFFFLFARLINCSIISLCRTSDIWLVCVALSVAPLGTVSFALPLIWPVVQRCSFCFFLFGAIINHSRVHIYLPVVDVVDRRWININIHISITIKISFSIPPQIHNARNSVAFFPFCHIVLW